jgi:hypothetical protein
MARNTLSTAFAFLAACLLAALLPSTNAQQLQNYNGSQTYRYYGCYNETVDLPGTAHERALPDGTHLIAQGTMTVPVCLAFCMNNGTTYKYAGVEFSRWVSLTWWRWDAGIADAPLAENAGAVTGSLLCRPRATTAFAIPPATET